MGILWYSYGVSIGFLFDFYGISMMFLWDYYGMSIESKLKSIKHKFKLNWKSIENQLKSIGPILFSPWSLNPKITLKCSLKLFRGHHFSRLRQGVTRCRDSDAQTIQTWAIHLGAEKNFRLDHWNLGKFNGNIMGISWEYHGNIMEYLSYLYGNIMNHTLVDLLMYNC